MCARIRHLAFPAGVLSGALAMALVELARSFPPSRAPESSHVTRPAASGFGAYRADVLRVIDGDTLEARVRVWPGHDVTTRVRLRGVDAPELRARCASERDKAERAAKALAGLIADTPVTLIGVGPDKFYGRVVADVLLADGEDAGRRLLADGHARAYAGRARLSWCG